MWSSLVRLKWYCPIDKIGFSKSLEVDDRIPVIWTLELQKLVPPAAPAAWHPPPPPPPLQVTASQGSNPASNGIFLVQSYQWLKNWHSSGTLPGVWCYRFSAGTGQPSVGILWLGVVEILICSFCLSMAAGKIVWSVPLQFLRLVIPSSSFLSSTSFSPSSSYSSSFFSFSHALPLLIVLLLLLLFYFFFFGFFFFLHLFILFHFSSSVPSSSAHRLLGIVVKASASGAQVPGFECDGIFHTSDFKIGTPVATLTGVWPYRVNTGTGQPGVHILWLGLIESLICSFYLSVAAHKIVWADPSLRYTSMLLGR